MNLSNKLALFFVFSFFLVACGNKEPTDLEVKKAIKEYENLSHNISMEWEGATIKMPVKYTYSKIEKLSCTMVGDGEAICSVNTAGESSMMNGAIVKSSSGVDKFHLYKENGVWRTGEAIAQNDSVKNTNTTYDKNLEYYGEPYAKAFSDLESNNWSKNREFIYSTYGSLTKGKYPFFPMGEDYLNPNTPNEVRRLVVANCLPGADKEFYECKNRKQYYKIIISDKVISKSDADKTFKENETTAD